MTLFSKLNEASRLKALAESQAAPAAEATPDAVAQGADPLAQLAEGDAGFTEQRERRASESGLENLDQSPMTIGKTDSDEEVAEGDFGKKVTKTGDKDVHVDADDSIVKHTAEAGAVDQSADVEQVAGTDDDDGEDDDYDTGDIEDDDSIDVLENEMVMLSESVIAIENYGVSAASMRIMQTTRLLSGTALESLGLESFGNYGPQAPESQMALESLGEKIKEKATEWATKILHVVKAAGEKISAVLGAVWAKISSTVSALSSKAWDATKAAGETIKAHPYASAAAIVTAIAAVAGVIAFAASGAPIPGTKSEAYVAFMAKMRAMIAKIPVPNGGSIKATLNSAGTKIGVVVEKGVAQAQGASLKALGWTQSQVKALGNQLGRAWELIKSNWGKLAAKASQMAGGAGKFVADAGKDAAGAARKMGGHIKNAAVTGYGEIAAMVVMLANLTRKFCVDGFHTILATLKAVASVVGTKASAAASATASAAKSAASAAAAAVKPGTAAAA